MSRYRSTSAFQPSVYSDTSKNYGVGLGAPYGAGDDSYVTDQNVSAAATFTKSLLGIDDPRARVVKLEAKIRTLKKGGLEATIAALPLLSIPDAIRKTEAQLVEAKAQAGQLKTRDMLYTALTATGVLAGGMLVIWLGVKTYKEMKHVSGE